ncbi:MAG: thioredoxin [Clostridiales bacterium]|nr:thioredoxin [Clostridiales bacterium]
MSIITITKNNFDTEVINSEKPVLLDFWATWCGPCTTLSPVVDQIADEITSVKVGKVNIDEEQVLAAQFNVMSIPTLLLFKNGKVVNKSVGVQPKNTIVNMLNNALK